MKSWGEQAATPPIHGRNWRPLFRYLVHGGFVVCSLWLLLRTDLRLPQWRSEPVTMTRGSEQQKCPQVEPLYPSIRSKSLDDMDEFLQSTSFRNMSIRRLSGAVQIPTESFDDMGKVGADPRWDIFYSFEGYLQKTFPLVHSTLQREKINTHALLYTWPGTDPSLKPTLLMAHQDVVPVPESTVKQWTHPPFSGFIDDKFVWGRGSSDCKNLLVGILEAVEALIDSGFAPRRTLILSFGFDEEISGPNGAKYLASYLLQKRGHNSMAVILDEGAQTAEAWGANFAMPGVAEKGAIDVDIVLRMPGGHSSIPPAHNGIGVASELITLIEAHPYEPYLADDNPYLSLLRCGAEHSPEFPPKLKRLLKQRDSGRSSCMKKKGKDALAIEASKVGLDIKYLMTTSVAVDIIHGGVKTNALPERTQFLVDHRVNVGSNSQAVLSHITSLAARVAQKHNLTLTPFNGTETPSSITLSYRSTALEPAPVTPTHIDPDHPSAYSILSGTTRALYGKDLLVAPGIMTGNTDTRYYWGLSENIFRYNPGWDKYQTGLGNIHTVDEKISADAHVDTVRWVWGFIRNMDEANL